MKVATCLDCEWTGKQAEVTVKWAHRRCPNCGSNKVEVRGPIEAHVDDWEFAVLHAGSLGGVQLD